MSRKEARIMAVQSFVKGDDLKKLIEDKLINAQSVKYVLRQKGILPVCISSEALSDLIYHHFFGSDTMTKMGVRTLSWT